MLLLVLFECILLLSSCSPHPPFFVTLFPVDGAEDFIFGAEDGDQMLDPCDYNAAHLLD